MRVKDSKNVRVVHLSNTAILPLSGRLFADIREFVYAKVRSDLLYSDLTMVSTICGIQISGPKPPIVR